MKKFLRLNKLTNEKEEYIGAEGTLKTIESIPRTNKTSGKKYFRFTGEINTPKGSVLVGGQVYEELIPYLGAVPTPGDLIDVNCKLSDLKVEKTNTRWNISDLHKVKSYISKIYYEDGSIKTAGYIKNGYKNGEWKTYYNSGELNISVKYKLNKKEGIEEVWLPSGQLLCKVNFRNDNKCGSFEYYYSNGQLKERGSFNKDSARDGIYEKYLENGVLEEKLFYYEGNIVKDLDEEIRNVLNETSTIDSSTDNAHSMDSNLMYRLEFNELLEHIYSSYAREFGERKLSEVMNKVITSKKVEGFIKESKLRKIPPHNNYIIQMLNEIPFFIFSRGQTIVVGAMLVLQMWNEEVNSKTNMLTDDELLQRAKFIINESKSMFF